MINKDNLVVINKLLNSIHYGMESYKNNPPETTNLQAYNLHNAVIDWQEDLAAVIKLLNSK